jgi:hypothetical protein
LVTCCAGQRQAAAAVRIKIPRCPGLLQLLDVTDDHRGDRIVVKETRGNTLQIGGGKRVDRKQLFVNGW